MKLAKFRASLLLILFALPLAGCQSLSPSKAQTCTSRGPSSAKSCSAYLGSTKKIFDVQEIQMEKGFHPEELPVNTLSKDIEKVFEVLGIPFQYREASLKQTSRIIEMTFTQFLDAFSSFKGGEDLVKILSNPKENQLGIRKKLQEWTDENIPGYKLDWSQTKKMTYSKEELANGFIEPSSYFTKLKQKKIPIGDHHDLLTHLFMFTLPEVRALTERLTLVHQKIIDHQKKATDKNELQELESHYEAINFIWELFQESFGLSYQKNGATHLIILGGRASVLDPFGPYVGDFNWHYLQTLPYVINRLLTPSALQNLKFKMASTDFLNFLRSHKIFIDDLVDAKTEFEKTSKNLSEEYRNIGAKAKTYAEIWDIISEAVFRPKSFGPQSSRLESFQLLNPEVQMDFTKHLLTLIESLYD